MLTDSEKEKIRLEEIYRNEVRSELDKEKKVKQSRLISFFNTNLGLFILSTILLSGSAFVYQLYESRKEELGKRELMENELRHRINTLQSLGDTLYWYQTTDIYLAFNGNSQASGLKPEYYNFQSVYQEFSNWPVTRLINEMLEIKSDSRLETILHLFQKNQETVNHLRENWFLRLNSGTVLPKGVSTELKTMLTNGRPVRYETYTVNGEEKVIQEQDRPITKMAKIDVSPEIKNLIDSLIDY